MTNKIWNYKNESYAASEIENLSRENRIPPLIALLLKNRGVTDSKAIVKYIKKTLDTIHDPFGLNDMQKAAERICTALSKNEKITVYGDYDVDGVTSTALVVRFLKDHGANVDYYIPDREGEGYGINIMAVNKISKSGTKLMITVDCGITACGEVEFAKTLGMDVIITDHHLCKEKLPTAVAVIDPKREDSEYEFDSLAGVGVAFKLVLATAKLLGEKTSDCFFRYVELAAIGTIADIVSLLDENRVIVEKGLSLMAETNNPGIKALLSVSGADKRPINATTIAFMLAPRINAGGRIGSADNAVKLLLSDNDKEATELASLLEEANNERRLCEQEIYDDAIKMIESDTEFSKKKVIVLAKRGWLPGVIGIVSSRITEKYYRPSILIAIDEKGSGKGSGRSVEGFNLFSALNACSDTLTTFGGHSLAAGVALNEKDIENFSVAINEYAKTELDRTELTPKLDIDCELSPKSVTPENAKMLEYMEPFGADNPKPIFSISNATIKKIDTMGADRTHLRMVIEKDGISLNTIGFRMSEYINYKKIGDRVSIAFSLEINNYKGNQTLQLILKDIK